MESPIFVVGVNRSGTTLLRLILNAHSRIAIPEELVYFDSRVEGVDIEQWRVPGISDVAYEAFVDHFLKEICASLEPLDKAALRLDILTQGPRDLRRPYALALSQWARRHGKVRWGEKTPGNLFYVDVIMEMFPQAQFIHVVRDPRAVVNSMLNVDFFSDDVVFNALAWRKHVEVGSRLLEAAVPDEQRTTVRYEDLVAAPEETVRSLCTFLGETYEPDMLAFYRSANRYMKEEAATDFNHAATQPISSKRVDKWEQQLSRGDVALIESICREPMRAHGYALVGAVLGVQGTLEAVTKRGYWRLQEWRNRSVRHYTVKSRMFARSRKRISRALRLRTLET